MRSKAKFIQIIVSCFCWLPSVPAAVQESWVARYNGPVSQDRSKAIAMDRSGNIYVIGQSAGTNYWPDYATVKYNSNGNQLWVARYNGPANRYDEPNALAVDSSGNVYVTGNSQVTDFNSDFTTIKYDADGHQLWLARYNGPGNGYDQPNALTLDAAGDVYVSGASLGTNTGDDFVTIKYDPDGHQLWVARYDGPGNKSDGAAAQAVDSAGNLYVTGLSYGSSPNLDFATLKLDADGNQLWVARHTQLTNGNNFSGGIGLDNAGNVYVTGSSPGANGSLDYLTLKYDADGRELWVRLYDAPSHGWDQSSAVAVDEAGNVYVTGSSSSLYQIEPSFGSLNYATVKYDSDGNLLWQARYRAAHSLADEPRALALDKAGNVYVTGVSGGDTLFDFATVKYNSLGKEAWVARYNGQGQSSDAAAALAVDDTGAVFVTGFVGAGRGVNFITIKYLQTNSAPVANASATLPLVIAPNNTSAGVILDGSRSSDPDHDSLEYFWSENGIVFATGVVTTNVLPVGKHAIELRVDDGTVSDSDSIAVEIITPCQAVRQVIGLISRASLARNARPLIATLDAACDFFQTGDLDAGANQLRVFQNKVQIQVAPRDQNLASQLVRQAQLIIDAVTD